MALTNMIPEVWSARFLANLDNILVAGNAINRDYQADAVFGSLIHINQLGDVTVGDYTRNQSIGAPQIMDSTDKPILIDQQKYFNIYVDSIDEAQSKPSVLNEAMNRAAYSMARQVDSRILALHAKATTAIGSGASPETPMVANVYGYLTEAAKILDEQNVPSTGRYMLMDPAGIKLLKDSGEMLSDTPTGDIVRTFGLFGGVTGAPEGYKGRIAGFDIWSSTNIVGDDQAEAVWMAGHPMGISLVDSLNRISGYEPEQMFGDAVKGVYVYGVEAVQPDAIVPLYVKYA